MSSSQSFGTLCAVSAATPTSVTFSFARCACTVGDAHTFFDPPTPALGLAPARRLGPGDPERSFTPTPAGEGSLVGVAPPDGGVPKAVFVTTAFHRSVPLPLLPLPLAPAPGPVIELIPVPLPHADPVPPLVPAPVFPTTNRPMVDATCCDNNGTGTRVSTRRINCTLRCGS